MSRFPEEKELERQKALRQYERLLHSYGYRMVAGVDEAGRGPLAGPVVAAAVILPKSVRLDGLRDSKCLSPKKRAQLYSAIYCTASAIGVGIVDHEVIDEINILNATRHAMQQAVSSLRPFPDYLLIDALNLPALSFPQSGVIHGDRLSFSIAAASVIAKVTRDRIMEDYHEAYPDYRFDMHKGYGTSEHLEYLRIHGPCPIHRRSFRGVLTH